MLSNSVIDSGRGADTGPVGAGGVTVAGVTEPSVGAIDSALDAADPGTTSNVWLS